MFRGIAPTERGGYSLREMAQQHGPVQYFNSLLGPPHEDRRRELAAEHEQRDRATATESGAIGRTLA